MLKPVVLLGAGGHAKVLLDLLSDNDREVLAVSAPELARNDQKLWRNIPIIDDDAVIQKYNSESIELVNGIGMIPGKNVRQQLYLSFKQHSMIFATLVHSTAILSATAKLSEGAQVFAGAIIQPDCTIGNNTIVNTRATVEHDCTIGSHCHIATAATLCGGVKLADQIHVGAGATIIQGLTLGQSSVVAAGSVLVKNLAERELNISCKPTIKQWSK